MWLLLLSFVHLLILIWCEEDTNPCGYYGARNRLVPHIRSISDSSTICCLPRNCTQGLRPELCTTADPEPRCTDCPAGQYNDGLISSMDVRLRDCRDGNVCRPEDEIETKPLTPESNRECACDLSRGFYRGRPGAPTIFRCTGPKECGVDTQLDQTGECVACPTGKYKNFTGKGFCVDIPILDVSQSPDATVTDMATASPLGNGSTNIGLIVGTLVVAFVLVVVLCCACYHQRRKLKKFLQNCSKAFCHRKTLEQRKPSKEGNEEPLGDKPPPASVNGSKSSSDGVSLLPEPDPRNSLIPGEDRQDASRSPLLPGLIRENPSGPTPNDKIHDAHTGGADDDDGVGSCVDWPGKKIFKIKHPIPPGSTVIYMENVGGVQYGDNNKVELQEPGTWPGKMWTDRETRITAMLKKLEDNYKDRTIRPDNRRDSYEGIDRVTMALPEVDHEHVEIDVDEVNDDRTITPDARCDRL